MLAQCSCPPHVRKRGTIKIAGVENAGVENEAPSSGAYSGFQVRWCEPKESGGRKSPSGIEKQSPGRAGVKIVCSYTLIVQLKFQNVQLNPTICAVNVSHEKI